ncbi:MAG: helix-turn-helix domain-containing protein, partial [Deltaproteobacteria bacterium]|nr:helix-turn-helix domain-containing protein [Deltaproteobacteria bacterium]
MEGPWAHPLKLRAPLRRELEAVVRARRAGAALVERASIVLLASRRLSNAAIARTLHVQEKTVRKW